MNRRQFLQRGAMATAAVVAGVKMAPAAALTIEHTTGAKVPVVFGQRRVSDSIDYYSIQWPTTTRSFSVGRYIGNGKMEHLAYFDKTGTAWVPDELQPIKNLLTYKYVPAVGG